MRLVCGQIACDDRSVSITKQQQAFHNESYTITCKSNVDIDESVSWLYKLESSSSYDVCLADEGGEAHNLCVGRIQEKCIDKKTHVLTINKLDAQFNNSEWRCTVHTLACSTSVGAFNSTIIQMKGNVYFVLKKVIRANNYISTC